MLLLRLRYGADTLTISGNGSTILDARYFPTFGDAAEALVTEDAMVIIEGSASQIIGVTRHIERFFEMARRRSRSRRADQVFIEYQSEADAAAYRSPLVDGRVTWDSDGIRRRLLASGSAPVEVQVTWTRANYWEGDEETGTFDGGGSTATILNGDGGNVATLGDIEGTLPAPIKLTVTNDAGTALFWQNFYIANDGSSGLASNEHILQSGSLVVLGTDPTHSTVAWPLTLSSTVLDKCAGEWFRVIAGFTSFPAGLYLRAGIYSYIWPLYKLLVAGQEVYNGPTIETELLDLGALPIPPMGDESATALVLAVTARGHFGSSQSATLDFVALMRADNFRRLRQNGYSADDGDAVVDDGLLGSTYALSGSTKYAIVDGIGGPLLVHPNATNRLQVLFNESTGALVPGRQMVLSYAYRPRRAVV